MSDPIFLLENEPLTTVGMKFVGWFVLMCVFVLLLIYFSNYFARERFESTGIPAADLRNQRFMYRFGATPLFGMI